MVNCKFGAVYFEILMKLYSFSKPVHCSYFVDESFLTNRDMFTPLNFLVEKGFVERPKIFITGEDSPFYRLSSSGKGLVEKIINNFYDASI